MNKYLIIAICILLGALTTQNFYFKNKITKKEFDWLESQQNLLLREKSKQEKLLDSISVLDEKHTKELSNAKQTIDKLRDDIRTGKRKLFIKTSCDRLPDTTASTGMDNAEARAELDARTAERIISITERGDNAIRQLTACQNYIVTIKEES